MRPDAVNDARSVNEDGGNIPGNVGDNDTDVDDGATHMFALVGPAPAGLTFNPNGSYSFNSGDAAYQHIALGATQIVTAAYTITDEHGASSTATLTITVTGANDAPDAVSDVINATEDGAVVTGSLATNDTDADDGATRTYVLLSPVAGLSLSPSGNYTFDPSSYDSVAAGATLIVSTSYRIFDNNGATDTATMIINVVGVNDAPDAINDSNTATEDGAIVTGNVVVQRRRCRWRRHADLSAQRLRRRADDRFGRQLQLRSLECGLSAHRGRARRRPSSPAIR